ncbi:MAG: IS66 family insertion sequence element accessory protein TnpB [Fibrobacteria bacterium]
MLSLPPLVRVFLCLEPTDMRKALMGLPPWSSTVSAWTHCPATCIASSTSPATKSKVIFWDTTGFCLFLKRLERGRFHLDSHADGDTVTPAMLQLILEGMELTESKRHARMRHPHP